MFTIIELQENTTINLNIIYDANKLKTDEPPPTPVFMKYLIMKMKYLELKKKLNNNY